jgi:hypothetical protein
MGGSPQRVLGIDPGDLHCGIAYLSGPDTQWVKEVDQGGLFRLLERSGRSLKDRDVTVVCESFMLYPWMLQQQGFSEMLTAQAIGVIKYLCARMAIPLVFQPASIQKPTEGQARARGIELQSVKQRTGPHCKSAELHALYRILKEGEE